MFYWAYGSNLNVEAMRRRCPAARQVKQMFVTDAALVFRGVADVTHRKGNMVPGGLWEITHKCEEVLDRYEGVNSRFYLKRYLPVKFKGKVRDCLFYQMRASNGVMPPSEYYLETIEQGYRDFGLDLAYLDVALQESWGSKEVTDWLANRHVRKGQPKLARIAS